MEIAQGIHRVEAPLGDRFVCMYILAGTDASLVIDTGLANMPKDNLLPYMENAGLEVNKIKYILNSHIDFDHTGGNLPMKELAPQAVTMCHELDRAWIDDVEVMIAQRYGAYQADHGIDESDESKAFIREYSKQMPVDLGIQGGLVLHLGSGWYVEILHTPGHSRGHISVHDPRSKTMLIMDAVLWNAVLTKEGNPAFPPTYRYVDTYLASMQRIGGYDLELMASSHYPVSDGKAAIAEFIGESRAFVQRVEAELRVLLQNASGAMTMKEIISELSPKLGTWPDAAGEYLVWPLSGHLERLQLYGLIETGQRDNLMTVRWKS